MYEGLLDSGKSPRKPFLAIIRRFISQIISSKETRNVFFFLVLNLSFCGVEFLVGFLNNSLGLVADAVHMLFDSTAIIFSLGASVVTKWEANSRYTYGYGRVETLTGFINALALVFASGNIMWEAVERLIHPHGDLGTDNLLVVSVLGLLVNIVGIFAFDHGGAHGHAGHDHGNPGHDHHGHSHDHSPSYYGHEHGHNPLMEGMLLHIISDALGSVGVIISSLLIQFFGWNWSDPVCSIFISLLTFMGSYPLLKRSAEVLLQRSPVALDHSLPSALTRIRQIPGLLGISHKHFWELRQDEYIGSIILQLNYNVDEQVVKSQVEMILRGLGINSLTIGIEKDVVAVY